MTVDNAAEQYIESCRLRGLSPRTIAHDRLLLNHFADYCAGHHVNDLREATLQTLLDFRRWIGQRRKPNGEPTSVQHANRHLRTVRQMFRMLAARHLILRDIGAELPPMRDPKRLPRGVMTKDEIMQLLRQPYLTTPAGFRDRTIFEVLFSTGLRGGELCRLTFYDVDLSARLIHVLQGKGKKDRVVPIGKTAAGYLAEYIRAVRPILLGDRQTSALFVTGQGDPFKTNNLRQQFILHRDRAGLSDRYSVHSLRHTCATEMLRGGASVRHVQELLGHSSIKTTQIYTRVVIDDLKKAHKRTAPSERRRVPADVRFDNGDAVRWTDRRNKPVWRRRKRRGNRPENG